MRLTIFIIDIAILLIIFAVIYLVYKAGKEDAISDTKKEKFKRKRGGESNGSN